MYGKQFVAALMFLAVAQVNAQEDEYGAEADLYEAAPEPDWEFTDAAVDISIPEGDWDISAATFELIEVAEDDAILDWSEALPEALADYAAEEGGYVLVGSADIDAQEGQTYAIGLQAASQTTGILAVSENLDLYTVYFDIADAEDGDLEGEPAWFSAEPVSEDGFEANSGVGDSWGQSFDGTTWNLWSYNGNDGSEDWTDDAYDVVYVESSAEGVWSSFTDSIELAAAGASRLLATATTASLLLAMM